MAKIEKTDDTKYWQESEVTRTFTIHSSLLVQALWKIVLSSLIKLNIHLLHNSGNPFLFVYLREMKTYDHINTYT